MTSGHKSSYFHLVFAVAIVVCGFSIAFGQAAARPNRGTMPTGSYAVSDLETISLTNGNLNIGIPLASLPPVAGGKLGLTLRAVYNSKLWDTVRRERQFDPVDPATKYVVSNLQLSGNGGWLIGGGYSISFVDAWDDYEWLSPSQTDPEYDLITQNRWTKIVLTTPDGATHELRPADYSAYGDGYLNHSYLRGYYKDNPNTVNGPVRYYSFDGSHLWAKIDPNPFVDPSNPSLGRFYGVAQSWTLYLPDGTKVEQLNGIQTITDTNGNKVKMFWTEASGIYTSHIQDEQTGREIKVVYDPVANGGWGQAQVQYQTVGGVWQTIAINYGSTHVFGKRYEFGDFECADAADYVDTEMTVIRSIVYPPTEPGQPGRQFTFTYNSDTTDTVNYQWRPSCWVPYETVTAASRGWGSLSQITMPSGAIVNYGHGLDGSHYLAFNPDEAPREGVTLKTVTHDGTSETWTYGVSPAAGGFTGPDGSSVTEWRYSSDPGFAHTYSGFGGKEELVYRTNSSNKVMVERHWTLMPFSGGENIAPGANVLVAFNPVVDAEYTSLLDDSPAHNPIKMSAKTFQYDYNGNLLQTIEYDWFDPSLVSRDAQGVPTGVPAGATVLRTTTNSYYNPATSSSSENVYAKRSMAPGLPLILNALKETTTFPARAQFSYDGQAYEVAPTVGNLTTKSVWFDLESRWITTSSTYDSYGNVASTTDGRLKITTFGYLNPALGLPTSVTVNPQNGTGLQTTTTAYDVSTGLVTSVTDANGNLSEINYTNQLLGSIDPFGRPGLIIGPDIGGGVNHLTKTFYADASRTVTVLSDLNSEGDGLLKSQTISDMLGRTVENRQYETASDFIAVRKSYDPPNRTEKTSNPFRAGEAVVWTTTVTDLLGRVISVTTPDNAALTTSYDANFTTVTDQTNRVRRSTVDALGRLIRVDEPDKNSGQLGSTAEPIQPTCYRYDVLGNLTKVIQGSQIDPVTGICALSGSQQRTFTYDSLSRLRTAVNPESGTISYNYDENGNLLVKTDARGVSSHYEYDGLNRTKRRWYNGSSSLTELAHNDPALPSGVGASDEAKYFYDSQSIPGGPTFDRGFAIGRLVATTYGGGNSGDYFGFDAMGRIKLKIQQTGGINYQTTAVYNLAGAITSMSYPSARTVTNSYDSAGRLQSFTGYLGDGTQRTYASDFEYTAWNGLQQEKFGTTTPIYHKQRYNARGQLWDMRASTVSFATDPANGDRGAIVNYYSNTFTQGGSGTDNNGNLLRQENYIPGSSFFQDNFEYDQLNRLKFIAEKLNGTGTDSFKQAYVYDRWGNRTIDQVSTSPNVPKPDFGVDTNNNRLTAPAGYTMGYDQTGNLTNDTFTGGGVRTYDAENRMTGAQASLPASYVYDGDGLRIKRIVNGVETWQVYGLGGELIAEYAANAAPTSPQKEYGYRNGEMLVTAEAGSGSSGSGPEPVIWTNAVGVSVSGNSLTKTAATGWGNAGAASTQSISSGDGFVEFTASETSTYRMLGLSNGDSNQDYTDIDFAIYPTGTGSGSSVYVYESGTYRGDFGTYATGDKLRVAVEGGVVKYRKNGTLLYTSTVTPSHPLLVDSSLFSEGSTINSVMLSGNLSNQISWTNAVGVSVSGNNLTKTAAEGWGNAGAASTQSIVSGDGYVEFTASETSTYRMLGLSNGDSNQDYTDIDFAIYPTGTGSGSHVYLYEGGVYRGDFGVYATGDLLRVAIEGGVVKYKKNGVVFHTSAVAATYPLLVDTSLYSIGSTISNVVISGNVSAVQNVNWTSAAGVSASGNNLTKTAADQWGNAGAASTQSIVSGDGYVEFTASETSTWRMCGLSNGDTDQNYSDIDFAMYPTGTGSGSHIYVYEGGVYRGDFGTYSTGDLLRVAIEGGVVKYKKNGVVFYTSTVAPTYPLLVDTSLYSSGSTLTNVVIGSSGSGSSSAQIRWLVTDQLGTPRMVFDQTGSLANVSRHDYLPFGEELFGGPPNQPGVGGRTTLMGYTLSDNVRQKFTQKERDNETGLDYFLARYYSSTQGRFTSIDSEGPIPSNPQTLNKYRYALNNPLRYVDPDGRQERDPWYRPILDYLRTVFGGTSTAGYPESNAPARDYSPMGLDARRVTEAHFKALVIASRANATAISTLDPTGGAAVVQNFMEGNTKGAVIAGALALPNLFGVGRGALTSGNLLIGNVGKAEVAAQFSKSGGTLTADVVGVFGAKESGGLGSTTKQLFNSIMGFAKEEGLKEVKLQAVAVVNDRLRSKLIKQGWQVTEVKVGDETVTAFTKTFAVK